MDERITVSLGVVAAGPEDDSEALLKRADGALYRAKREGRDRAIAG
jgi:diguanylate cyclase (GGDEF)-like protein